MKRNWGWRGGLYHFAEGPAENLKASYKSAAATAPLEKGQVVGTIDFKLNDKTY